MEEEEEVEVTSDKGGDKVEEDAWSLDLKKKDEEDVFVLRVRYMRLEERYRYERGGEFYI